MSLMALEKMVRERTGIDPESLGPNAFRTAIANRMTATQAATHSAYAERIRSDATEWDALVNALVVPESWFFRGGRALFDVLARGLMEKADRTREPARALCVPCGIGEEPYSLAIALHELGASAKAVQIEGWDLSPVHVARTEAARFSSFSFRHTEDAFRERYFEATPPNQWTLKPEMRSRVRTRRVNLADDSAERDVPPFDLILCRNVFIYLTPDAQRRAMANLDRWLKPDGRLCLGHAEADRLPAKQFVSEGPIRLLIFERASAETRVSPIARKSTSTPHLTPRVEVQPKVANLTLPIPKRRSSTSVPAISPTDLLANVRDLANRGRLDEALAACSQLVNPHQPSAEVFGLLGVIHLARGQSQDAFNAFTRSLYLDPNHAESLEHLAVLCEQRGDVSRSTTLRKRLTRVQSGGHA